MNQQNIDNIDQSQKDEAPIEHFITAGEPGDAIVAQFIRQGDRFRHQINLVSSQSEFVIADSVEHSGSDITSPPLQQIVTETHGDSKVVLAVGQADKNHWSGSFGTTAENRLLVEFACRVNQSVSGLGSIYQVHPDCQVTESDSQKFSLKIGEQTITFLAGNGTGNSSGSILTWDAANRTLTILPDPTPSVAAESTAELPVTVTWNYCIEKSAGDRGQSM